MISVKIGECDVDIIPIIRGLKSETDKVVDALSKKEYEAAAVAWGIEDVEAVRRRDEIEGETETNDLDTVYSYKLLTFGDIDMPDPSFTYLIDEFAKKDKSVIPLDMNDELYSKHYCENVSTLEFLKEKRVVKKALKKEFDMSSPETFIIEWDALMNTIKGYLNMSRLREEYIAGQIEDLAKYKKNAIVLVDYERLDGIMNHLSCSE